MTTELATIERATNQIELQPLTARDIRAQVNLIQEVMREVMKDGEHYGKVPGCGDKPTLLQPGAQKLVMTFRLVPDVESTVVPMERGHREVRTKVRIYARGTNGDEHGPLLGVGVGTCSTMEGKYRFRTGPVEFTDKPVPKQYWDLRSSDPEKAKQLLGVGHVPKKNDQGIWMCAIQGGKVEHDNPADCYNTVEKISFKRALVSCTLNVTAASDIFAQDIEDMPEVFKGAASAPAVESPAATPAPAAPAGHGKAASVLDKMKPKENGKGDVGHTQPLQTTASQPGSNQDAPSPSSPVSGELDAAWLSSVLDCEDWLRGTQQGKGSLRSIRAGFHLEDGAYPMLPQDQKDYLSDLQRTVERLQKA